MTPRRLLRDAATALLAVAALLPGPARAQAVARAPSGAPYATGQLIAVSEMRRDPSTLLFEGFTASRYGHIGVVACEPTGVFVYHAAPPAVQKVPLADFLLRARTEVPGPPAFTVVEPVKPLTPAERDALVETMGKMVGKVPYNYSMVMNDCSVNCSEFAHKAFRAVGRDEVGRPEPLSGMNEGSFAGLLAQAWRRATGKDLPPGDSLGVSPAAIVNSPGLRVVYAGLPVERLLSDLDIYEAWRLGGGLERFAQIFRVPAVQLAEAAHRPEGRVPYRPYPKSWRPPSP